MSDKPQPVVQGTVERQSFTTLILAMLTLLIVIPTLVMAVVTFVRVDGKDCSKDVGTTIELVDSRSPISVSPGNVDSAADDSGSDNEDSHKEAEEPLHWGYDDTNGPSKWASMGYSLCGEGTQQSPINIVTADVKDPRADETSVTRASFKDVGKLVETDFSDLVKVVHNGHAVTISEVPAYFTHNNVWYKLAQFHLHTPSEHTVDGVAAAGEIHFVHQSATGDYLVVAVFIDQAEASPDYLLPILSDFPESPEEGVETSTFDYTAMLDAIIDEGGAASFWTYPGSFTTPPCTERVTWILHQKRVGLSLEHLTALRAALKNNFRPTQPLNERQVLAKTD